MPKGHAIDLDALQRYLYRRTDGKGRIRIHQQQLAEELGITNVSVCRALTRLEEQGRIRTLIRGRHNVQTWIIKEPEK